MTPGEVEAYRQDIEVNKETTDSTASSLIACRQVSVMGSAVPRPIKSFTWVDIFPIFDCALVSRSRYTAVRRAFLLSWCARSLEWAMKLPRQFRCARRLPALPSTSHALTLSFFDVRPSHCPSLLVAETSLVSAFLLVCCPYGPLRRCDRTGLAKTGSGKTLSFLWPMFMHILDQPQVRIISAELWAKLSADIVG